MDELSSISISRCNNVYENRKQTIFLKLCLGLLRTLYNKPEMGGWGEKGGRELINLSALSEVSIADFSSLSHTG